MPVFRLQMDDVGLKFWAQAFRHHRLHVEGPWRERMWKAKRRLAQAHEDIKASLPQQKLLTYEPMH